MNLAANLLDQLSNSSLRFSERMRLSCQLSRELEASGDYEGSMRALGSLWLEVGERPNLDGLDSLTSAEVLLRIGVLTSGIGNSKSIVGAQEAAKDLISESVRIFEGLNREERVAEAKAELALCYWREGGFDEARLLLQQVLENLDEKWLEVRLLVVLRRALFEGWSGRFNDALKILNDSAEMFNICSDEGLKGRFHNNLALMLTNLATNHPRNDYLDRALIEYTAASFHFEKAGHVRYCARVENNLGFQFLAIRKFGEAHTHINRARQLFVSLGDQGSIAQVDETRARTLLAEGHLQEAERVVRSAVKTLEKGGEQALLAEALTTYGIVQARLGNYSRSKSLLQNAIEVAETAGDLEGAGRAQLSIIEELAQQTSPQEMASIYELAAELLQRSQDPSAGKRLISCARKVIDALLAAERSQDPDAKAYSWEGFSFKEEVVRIEKSLIQRALKEAGGSVTRAARLLGFKHHQSLIALINTRHKDLLQTRSAVRKRRHHLFSKPRKIKRKIVKPGPERANSQISILHVEDDKSIARLVEDMFDIQEWRVDLCRDGDSALRKLTGNDHYDVLLVDNDIPGLSGIELVQRARKITHRRRAPIVMLSGSDCEAEAWGAGVDAFLRKPDQIRQLPSTITRILEGGAERT